MQVDEAWMNQKAIAIFESGCIIKSKIQFYKLLFLELRKMDHLQLVESIVNQPMSLSTKDKERLEEIQQDIRKLQNQRDQLNRNLMKDHTQVNGVEGKKLQLIRNKIEKLHVQEWKLITKGVHLYRQIEHDNAEKTYHNLKQKQLKLSSVRKIKK